MPLGVALFVDYSSLSYQIKLIAELNKKKIEVNANKLQFATHMISLLEMWLQKEGTNIKEPAEYYQRLLMSMPTEPECALVRVRSKIADMVEENSPILQDLDGENGFFVRINSYAESQGVKEVELQGVKEEESRSYVHEMGGLHAMQEAADQCGKCRSWIHAGSWLRTASASTTRPTTSTRYCQVQRRSSSSSIVTTARRTLEPLC